MLCDDPRRAVGCIGGRIVVVRIPICLPARAFMSGGVRSLCTMIVMLALKISKKMMNPVRL